MKGEIWKTIRDFPDYNVSNFGRIRSYKSGAPKVLKPYHKEYSNISLCRFGECKKYKVHRLVGFYFIKGRSKIRNEINHKDGNTRNNKAVNLEWVTAKENSRHRTEFLNKRNSKLTTFDVLFIREIYPDFTYQQIADMFFIAKGSAHRIINKLYWTHL